MDQELFAVIVEELDEAETIDELMAMLNYGHGYEDPSLEEVFARNRERLAPAPKTEREREIVALEAELAAVRAKLGLATVSVEPPKEVKKAVRISSRPYRKYRLLSKDVEWTTTPQVRALMAIIGAHVEVGEIVTDEELVRMCVANEKTILNTKQGGERILRYYLGNHARGLLEHGNLEVVG